jgi:hypothetical protein
VSSTVGDGAVGAPSRPWAASGGGSLPGGAGGGCQVVERRRQTPRGGGGGGCQSSRGRAARRGGKRWQAPLSHDRGSIREVVVAEFAPLVMEPRGDEGRSVPTMMCTRMSTDDSCTGLSKGSTNTDKKWVRCQKT